MAFSAAGLNCIGVGPQKLYIYNTADTIVSSPSGSIAQFNTTNCPGMVAGDVIMLAHNTAAALGLIRVTAIDASSCTFTQNAALA